MSNGNPGLQWHDSDDRRRPGEWRSLVLTAVDVPPPTLVVSACDPRCLRLTCCDSAILWARVADDHYGYDLLRTRRVESLGSLPPISFALAEEQTRSANPIRA